MRDDPDDDIDWTGLKRLRADFLECPTPAGARPTALADYWRDERLLRSYDATFAERIGWKWDAVLTELATRGFAPAPGSHLYDWGTGTGVAVRRAVAAWRDHGLASARLWDRSAAALAFATARLRASAPSTPVRGWIPAQAFPERPAILLVSHVVTELDEPMLNALTDLAARADVVVWVEPGTSDASRALIGVRERLRPTFQVIAPCTHAAACGMLAPANARHWCHHFARPPQEASRDADWRLFGERLGIDLRSLPVSFLALAQPPTTATALDPAATARVIGRVREYKGYQKILACSADGVDERTLMKRHDKALFKALGKGAFTQLVPALAATPPVESTDAEGPS